MKSALACRSRRERAKTKKPDNWEIVSKPSPVRKPTAVLRKTTLSLKAMDDTITPGANTPAESGKVVDKWFKIRSTEKPEHEFRGCLTR